MEAHEKLSESEQAIYINWAILKQQFDRCLTEKKMNIVVIATMMENVQEALTDHYKIATGK